MPRIMCTQTLWSSLGNEGPAPDAVPEQPLHGIALGSWAAKMFRDEGRHLVLVMDERTRAALVFPLAPRKRFTENFADALRALLEDLDVPPGTVAAETHALAFEPLCRLTSKELVEKLGDLQYICELELMYHTDLRVVQFNLNDFPHGSPGPILSKEAIAELFGEIPGARGPGLH